jgi:hypothetical protein
MININVMACGSLKRVLYQSVKNSSIEKPFI